MYIETSSQVQDDVARLISPSISNNMKCLEFWYHMYGSSTEELRVYLRLTGSSLPDVLTWSKTGDKGDVWLRARVHLDEGSDFNVIFEGVRGSSFRGDIVIDDVSFRTTPCGGDCDFDTDVCGYQQDNTDDFDWTRQQRTTQTSDTGPSADHTPGSLIGSYMYIEASNRQPGDVARLMGPSLSNDAKCLEFWYHMYGDHTEELRVYQSSTGSSQLGTPKWSLAGDQGDAWHNATVGLVAGSNFYVVFEGVRGSSFEGDIAIDDVSIRTTSCGGATVAPTPTVDTTAATAGKSTTYPVTAVAETTAPLQVTTPAPSTQRAATEMAPTTPEASTPAATTTEAVPSERDCDFDTDVCGYQQDNTDDFDWRRQQSSTGSSGTGPSSDHTTGSGYYMYIEASNRQPGDVARLISPSLSSNVKCLEFWYHMYGDHIEELRVYQRLSGSAQLGTPIVFEGVRGTSYRGDIAIDDISLSTTSCGGGGVDVGGGDCSFDTTLCSYQQDDTDDFDWTRENGNTGTPDTGPSSDHTTGSGYYMYIETSSPRQPGDVARLISPALSYNTRCLEFWYHMYGSHAEELNVYIKPTTSSQIGTAIWSLTGDQDAPIVPDTCGNPTDLTTDTAMFTSPNYGISNYPDDSSCSWRIISPSGSRILLSFSSFRLEIVNSACLYDYVHIFDGGSESRPSLGRFCGTTIPGPFTSSSNALYVKFRSDDSISDTGFSASYITIYPTTPIVTTKTTTEDPTTTLVTTSLTTSDKATTTLTTQQLTTKPTTTASETTALLQPTTHEQQSTESATTNMVSLTTHIMATTTPYVTTPETTAVETTTTPDVSTVVVDETSESVQTFGTTTADKTPSSTTSEPTTTYGETTDASTTQLTTTSYTTSIESTMSTSTQGSLTSAVTSPTSYGETTEDYSLSTVTDMTTDPDITTPTGTLEQTSTFKDVTSTTTDATSTQFSASAVDTESPIGSTAVAVTTDLTTVEDTTHGTTVAMSTVAMSTSTASSSTVNQSSVPSESTEGSTAVGITDMTTGEETTVDVTAAMSTVTSAAYSATALNSSIEIETATPTQSLTSTVKGSTQIVETASSSSSMSTTKLPQTNPTKPNVLSTASTSKPGPTKPSTEVFTTGKAPSCGKYCTTETDSKPTVKPEANAQGGVSTGVIIGGAAAGGVVFLLMIAITIVTILRKSKGQTNTYLEAANPMYDVAMGTMKNGGTSGYGEDDVETDGIYSSPRGSPSHKVYDVIPNGQGMVSQKRLEMAGMCRLNFPRSLSWALLGLAFALQWTSSLQQGDCNFDIALCSYQQDNTDDFDWTRQQGSTATTNTGPSSDHTTGSGYYMYIETSSQVQDNIARLISPSISNNIRCLEFWYHMYGDHTEELGVYLRPTGSSLPAVLTWTKTGDKGDVWQRARVNLDEGSNFNVVFEGVRGTSFRGDIAIDDISFRTTPCGGDCDFDTTLCGYQQDNTDDFDWTRQKDSTGTSDTGPSSDHTSGSGLFMYIEASNRQPGDVARLISPVLSSDTRCLEFWYHMYGSDTEGLRVYQSSTGSSQLGTPIWSLTGDQGDAWHNATVDLMSGSNLYVVFEGVRGNHFHGDITIDDVSFRTTSCDGGGDCDFDTDVCSYQQDRTDDFDWAREYGISMTSNTGPLSDHTGNGYYMYIEASSPQQPGDVARLISPSLSTNTRCLEFWYHMYGSSIGELRVYQTPTDNPQLGTPIWSLAGDQGNVWDQARLDLAAVTNFNVVFEGVRGSGIYGDIAIDDVSFRSTPCGNGDCDFDTGLCGYQQGNTDDFDWTRHQGGTSTGNTGPSIDHTTGSGYYMYIEVSNKPLGAAARLISPNLSNNIRCLEFWYHMYGDGTEELNVYQRFTGSAELGTPIWHETGDQA
ncbi:MAM and LDL-receptor class A domain-containing protein 1-like, partial [Branchiostoma lanceolatum]|uniref:MAM and LDL-receptor class A domain-containing protein 1-like n=1 Tax=Branchiostoma lanceolatum TaxID=7740 RepID=UPI003451F164